MSTLSTRERRQQSARKHARRVWTCPRCGMICRGNGGKSSHKKKCDRDALSTDA